VTQAESPIIRTQNLTKKYSSTEALAGITLEVPEGSVFALVGPNGAGKSTAIKTILNLVKPTSGRAEVMGIDTASLGPPEFARIGYVSENQELPEWMPVAYFLSYCREFYPTWRDEDAAALLRLYELPLDRPIKELSRGMRVKAALASALSFRPRLIVLDEPFSGLDVLVREELIESILERTPESTVLIASHDLSEIESFASHIAYLDSGSLQFVEELGALSERFREVEVTLDSAEELPHEWPHHWLNQERSSVVVRFTDSRFDRERSEIEVQRLFSGVRGITIRNLPLRSILVALAKSARKSRSAG
jgi:ABC-2 type transport system ATP-binding protein